MKNNLLIGIESEGYYPSEYDEDDICPNGWGIDDDGSIERPNHCISAEFKFIGPIGIYGAKKRLKFLEEKANKYDINGNSSCGVHIHLSLKELPEDRLISNRIHKFIYFYSMMEPIIFATCSRSRLLNSYCEPLTSWISPNEILKFSGEEIITIICGSSKNFLKKNLFQLEEPLVIESPRFLALNLTAQEKHGTFEFRHFNSSFSEEKIMMWVNLCSSILLSGMSEKLSYKKISTQLNNLKTEKDLRNILENLCFLNKKTVAQIIKRINELAERNGHSNGIEYIGKIKNAIEDSLSYKGDNDLFKINKSEREKIFNNLIRTINKDLSKYITSSIIGKDQIAKLKLELVNRCNRSYDLSTPANNNYTKEILLSFLDADSLKNIIKTFADLSIVNCRNEELMKGAITALFRADSNYADRVIAKINS